MSESSESCVAKPNGTLATSFTATDGGTGGVSSYLGVLLHSPEAHEGMDAHGMT